MIRVLIADDQALVRAGFRMILESHEDIEIVGEVEDGAQAVTLARELAPDVVLMDIRMPRLDGLEATRRLLLDGPNGTHDTWKRSRKLGLPEASGLTLNRLGAGLLKDEG